LEIWTRAIPRASRAGRASWASRWGRIWARTGTRWGIASRQARTWAKAWHCSRPTARPHAVSEPWSQVDKKKQPVAVAEPGGALTKFTDECTAETDHCLRPWVWFVDIGADKIIPARWTGTAWRRAADPDSPVEGARLGYRTRPAKEAEVKVGATVLVYTSDRPPPSEYEAHMWGNWKLGKVASVDAAGHRFDLEDEASHFAIANARILVLGWIAGEKAEAVDP